MVPRDVRHLLLRSTLAIKGQQISCLVRERLRFLYVYVSKIYTTVIQLYNSLVGLI